MSDISEESTKEEVVEYFVKKYNIAEEAKNNIIKEDISGDILLNICDADFKYLKIKIGQYKKIQKYLEQNKDKFKDKEIKEVITAKSNLDQVKIFFERCLNFKGNLNDLDGKRLIELDEEKMKKLGLNLGQRKKLSKYIEYFKTLKIEELSEDEEIIISKESNEEEVAKFLEKKLKFSKKSIEDLGLDGEVLFALNETEIDGLTELKEEERENLKKYLKTEKEKENFNNNPKNEIIINNKSTNEEVAKFLKEKLGFKDESINALELDGDSLFSLEDAEIDELTEISQTERDNLKNYLKEEKSKIGSKEPTKQEKDSITDSKQEKVPEPKLDQEPEKELILTEKSTKDEVDKYLKEKLNFSDKAIKSFNLNGKNLFALDGNGIEELKGINEKEKEKLRKFLNIEKPSKKEEEIRKKIAKETTKEELKAFFKQYLNLEKEKYDSINKSQIDKLYELTKEEKDILKQFLKEQKEKIELFKSDDKPNDKSKLENVDIKIDEDNHNNKPKGTVIKKDAPHFPKDNLLERNERKSKEDKKKI